MRRHLQMAAIFAIATVFASCSDEPAPFEPIPDEESLALVGTVSDAEGRPVADARVVLEPLVDGRSARLRAALDLPKPSLGKAAATRSALTGVDGRFRFEDVASGEHLLTADARDHLGAVTEVTIPELAMAAAETVIVDVQLTPTGTIAGLVELENAVSLEGTVVYVAGTSYVGVTDDEGGFYIYDVPLGTWDVVATHDDYVDQQQQVQISFAGELATFPEIMLLLDTNMPPTGAPALVPKPVAGENLFEPTTLAPNASDVDGAVILYEWDFDNDGTFDWADSTTGDVQFQYASPGIKRPKLRLTDDDGARSLSIADPFEVFDAIYVSTSGQDANPGTRRDPVATIDQAMLLAAAQKQPVIVATGTYATFTPQSGIDVYGGYDETNWTRGPGQRSKIVSSSYYGIVFEQISDVTYRYLEFSAADSPSGFYSSIGAVFVSSDNALEFVDCVFRGGQGATGRDTAPVTSAQPGDDGNNGSLAFTYNNGGGGAGGIRTTGFFSGDGGSGGRGTYLDGSTWVSARDGNDGGASDAGSGGDGGLLFAFSGDCANGLSGLDGLDGLDGTNGSGAPSVLGRYSSVYYWAPNWAFDGTSGEDGSGGGGGAGSGGAAAGDCTTQGAGGGGGGSGGEGGSGGQGGNGGTASIGVALTLSEVRFVDCRFVAGDGGTGGAGGNSALGAVGGSGGLGVDTGSQQSGAGGDGGDGGDGGGGQGGPGGPSIALFRYAGTADLVNPTFQTGTPGAGGIGGLGYRYLLSLRQRADSGPAGVALDELDLTP